MKLLRFGPKGQEKPGILDADGNIRDLSAHTRDFYGDAVSIEALSKLSSIDPASLPLVADGVRIGSCLSDVPNFFCIGLNYAKHAAETNATPPKEPIVFSKASSEKTDWEVELGVIIGREALYVSEADALDYVSAYCTINDVSERAFQIERSGQWIKGKSAPTFGPIGPYLVTADEVPDPQALDVELTLNGEVQQSESTSDMIFTVRQIVSHMSQFMKLQPGDIIATGTPSGVGMGQNPQRFLKPGDVMEIEVKGLGRQRQVAQAAS
jgi:2,4-diketo-3-deoxy-L-fuconate hydrolase